MRKYNFTWKLLIFEKISQYRYSLDRQRRNFSINVGRFALLIYDRNWRPPKTFSELQQEINEARTRMFDRLRRTIIFGVGDEEYIRKVKWDPLKTESDIFLEDLNRRF